MPSFSKRMSFRRSSSKEDKSGGVSASANGNGEVKAVPEVGGEKPKQNGTSVGVNGETKQVVSGHGRKGGDPSALLLHDGSVLRIEVVEGAKNVSAAQVTFKHNSTDGQQLSTWTVITSFTPPGASFDDTLILSSASETLPSPAEYARWLWLTLYWYFQLTRTPLPPTGTKPGAPRREWSVTIGSPKDKGYRDLLYAVEAMGLIYSTSASAARSADESFHVLRKCFWQIPAEAFYPTAGSSVAFPRPLQFTLPSAPTGRHPLRSKPPAPGTVFYRRYIPSLHSYLSFRTADLTRDVPLITGWMNNPRVDAFWGEAGPEEKIAEFLRKGLEDRHCFPVIGAWEDLEEEEEGEGKERRGEVVPFGYFEVYWVKEDRLAGYTETGEWDRGVHVLVGEERFRGYHRLEVWLSSLVHYMFLSDPRTQTLMLEPRVDNEKFIGYLVKGGFYKEKEFAFPHKQAAVMKLRREAWDGPAS